MSSEKDKTSALCPPLPVRFDETIMARLDEDSKATGLAKAAIVRKIVAEYYQTNATVSVRRVKFPGRAVIEALRSDLAPVSANLNQGQREFNRTGLVPAGLTEVYDILKTVLTKIDSVLMVPGKPETSENPKADFTSGRSDMFTPPSVNTVPGSIFDEEIVKEGASPADRVRAQQRNGKYAVLVRQQEDLQKLINDKAAAVEPVRPEQGLREEVAGNYREIIESMTLGDD